MAARSLDELLGGFGRLDDAPGSETGRTRFRNFLRDNAPDLDVIDDYIRTCRARPDEQHDRALQDLLNHLGTRLGFDVEYGPYVRLPGSIASHGRWVSPAGDQVVVEIRRRESYADQRPTLARLLEQLIHERRIAGWDRALGLYILTEPGIDPRHLEKSIQSESRTHSLRMVRPESLLSLARLVESGSIAHADVMTLLGATRPEIDPLVELTSRITTGSAAAGRRRAQVEWEDLAEGVGEVIERLGDLMVEGLEAVFGTEAWCDPDRRTER